MFHKIARFSVLGVFLCLFAPVPLILAQTGDLLKEGPWSVASPAGNCGGILLLQVKGPGSLFDAQNAAALAALEKNLPAAVGRVCPGVREAIVVSGRKRRLVRLNNPAPAMPAATPVSAAPAEPAPVSPPSPSARPAPPSPAQATVLPSQAAVPAIVNSSLLRSLASARSTEDKCDVLLAWLESSRMDSPANSRFVMPAQMLTVFRDEPMTAVFGMTYERTENRWRIEEYQKVISRCLGIARPQARAPYGIGRPNLNAERQYSAQFSQYRQVLDQAFLGSPGPDEPTAIVRYLQQIREQLAWAASAMSAAASGAPTKETFDRIRTDAQSANGKLPLLSASEKKRVTDYLTKREADLAPAIVDGWFREASSLPRTRASASQLLTSHNSIAPVLTALDGSARNEWERKHKELIDSMIADSVAAQTAKLREIPPTLAGLPQLVSWRTAFTSEFGEFGGSPLVSAALQQYSEAQSRVARGAFPAWLQQAQKVPVDGEAITAKRRELDAWFPARADRASPLLAQYEAPLKAKEDELRARVEAERRKQEEQARVAVARERQGGSTAPATGSSRASAPAGGAPLTPGSFITSGLSDQKLFASFYLGEFENINVEREDLKFLTFYGQFLQSYAQQCDRFLPANKVEMTRQECETERVTRNGYGTEISRACISYRTVGTGLYADPEMYSAMNRIDALAAGDAFRTMAKMMSQRDPLAGAVNMLNDAQVAKNDMASLLETNGCATPGTRRFQENLRRFALNQQPLRIGGKPASTSVIDPLPGIPFKDQNYTRLLDDLITDNSHSWALNRYVQGSVTGAGVMSRDDRGRPTKIGARYLYNGKTSGGVTLTFVDGMPECLYFNDMPWSCRTPNRRIAAKYAEGAYQQ